MHAESAVESETVGANETDDILGHLVGVFQRSPAVSRVCWHGFWRVFWRALYRVLRRLRREYARAQAPLML